MNKKIKNIDEYIEFYPREVQKKLKLLRSTIKKLLGSGGEAIAYGMPTYKVGSKNLVHFAAFKNHIGFYPAPSGVSKFKNDLLKYKTSKGAAQFPLDGEIPIKLIEKIVKFRLKELNSKNK